MTSPRLCVICGARVTNRNPRTTTCSPDCTAIKNGTPAREMHFRHCANPNCGIAISHGRYCDACKLDFEAPLCEDCESGLQELEPDKPENPNL